MQNQNTLLTKNLFSVALTLSLFTLSSAASSAEHFNNFWLTPSASQKSAETVNGEFRSSLQLVNKFADHSKTLDVSNRISSSQFSGELGSMGFTLATKYSDTEFSRAFAAQFGAVTLFQNSGRGESYLKNESAYSGLNPYSFHGGNFAKYRYNGTSASYSLNNTHHFQVGESTVYAGRLENRRARFVDYSNDRFFARYTKVERGGSSVADGFDAGINVGKFAIGIQRLKSVTDTSTNRIRFNWNKTPSNQYWLDLSSHHNALLEENSDKRFMFTWQHNFGAKKKYYSSLAGEDKPQAKGKSRNRGILIGGAVAAAAILASSGSSSQDTAVRVSADQKPTTPSTDPNIKAQHDAARIRFNVINPISTRENLEYGGYVYQAADGSYATTEPVRGDSSSVALPDKVEAVPAGTITKASYHTHAGFDPAFDSENFSGADLEGDRFDKIDGYLATPQGAFKYHEVATGKIEVLGTVNK